MTRPWVLAGSLVKLRTEINAAYPLRSKISDGSIGDPDHSARASDHNPDKLGYVRAIDVTQWDPLTPNNHADDVAQALARHLQTRRDPRIKYVIWRGQMFSSYKTSTRPAWTWRTYTGSNGHFHHVHVSVVADARGLDASPWHFTNAQEADDMTPAQAKILEEARDHAAAADLRAQDCGQRLDRIEKLLKEAMRR